MRIHATLATLGLLALACLAGGAEDDTSAVRLRIIDAETKQELAGLVKIVDDEGASLHPVELIRRGMGLGDDLPIQEWAVVPTKATVRLPRKKLTIEAIAGIEYAANQTSIDLTDQPSAEITLPLERIFDRRAEGYKTANTHLHLMKVSREECDRYLREIPKADDLDLVFVSYLERAVADKEYTSNHYSKEDLAEISRQSGVLLGNGEEHRHNFAGFGQGFGHVMLLNITQLVQPVSIGPGIMKAGTDGIPLRRGLNSARNDGATLLWCHNDWGLEAVPNWILGNVDAQNIFDGGIRSSYKDSFYRYLNAGLRVPFSTGTDWFMYDFSRVYAVLDEPLTVESWLKALREGKTFITNGPLLSLTVNGKSFGQTVALPKAATVEVVAEAVGRVDFERIELIHNGKIIAIGTTLKHRSKVTATIEQSIKIDEPGWFALRTPPPSLQGVEEPQEKRPLNELGRELFAHTSAVYVDVAGRHIFDRNVAEGMLAEMRESVKTISENGLFEDEQAKQRVLDVYFDGITALEAKLKNEATAPTTAR